MNYRNVFACLVSVLVFDTAPVIAGAMSKGTFIGNYDDYGGNVSASMGQGFGYIRNKKSFDLKEEDSHIKGFNALLRWEWPKASKPSHDDHNYMIVCWSNFDDLSVSNQAEDEWQEIDMTKLPDKFTPEAFYYDLWFSVCKNETSRY